MNKTVYYIMCYNVVLNLYIYYIFQLQSNISLLESFNKDQDISRIAFIPEHSIVISSGFRFYRKFQVYQKLEIIK